MSVQVIGSGTIGGLDEGLNITGVVTATSFDGNINGTVGVGTDNPQGVLHVAITNTTVWPFSTSVSANPSYTPYSHELVIDNDVSNVTGSFAGIYFNAGGYATTSTVSRVSTARIAAIDTGDYKADLAFSTRGFGGSNHKEHLRIEAGGNIGIGTHNPNNLLHVFGGQIKAQSNPTDTSTDLDLIRAQCGSTGNALFSIRAKDAADNNSDWDIKTNADEDLSFTIGAGSEKLRINSDGRLLIGSSSVVNVGGASNSGYLQIEGTSANSSSIALINNQNANNSPVIRFGKTRGTSTGAVTTVADADVLGRIAFAGADGTDLQNSTAVIEAKVNGTVAGDQIPTDLIFETSATDNSSRTERFRITGIGSVGINQSNPTAKLQVTGGGAYTVANSGRSVEGIDINSSSGDVDGAFGGAISFGVGQAGRSAIAAVQNSSDEDNTGLAFFTHPSNTGAADAVERVRIDSTGAIGIGTVTPSNDIQLVNDSATVKLTSTGSGNSTRLILVSEADTYGGVHFGDPADEDAGRIRYYHDDNSMQFTTNGGSEKIRIDSGGRVLINKDGGATGSATTPAFQIGGDTNYRLGMYVTAEAGVFANKNGDDGIQFHTKLGATDASGIGEAMRLTSRGYRQIAHRHFSYSFTNNVAVNTITFGDPGDAKYNHYELLIMFRDNAYRQAIGGGRYAVTSTNANGGPGVSYHIHEYYYDLGSKNGTWTFAAAVSTSGVLQITVNESSNNQGAGYIDITIIDAIGSANGTFGTIST